MFPNIKSSTYIPPRKNVHSILSINFVSLYLHLSFWSWWKPMFLNVSKSKRHSWADCLRSLIHLNNFTRGCIIVGSRPGGRFSHNSFCRGKYENASLMSIMVIWRDSAAAILKRSLILRLEAVSAKVSKNVVSSWKLYRFVFVDSPVRIKAKIENNLTKNNFDCCISGRFIGDKS